jgi:hypothetical protein
MRKNLFTSYAMVAFAGCTLYSCTIYTDPYVVPEYRQKENYYDVTSKPNTPLLSKKQDLALGGNYGSGEKHHGGNLEAAYAITDHFALAANLCFTTNGSSNDNSRSVINNYELAGGYFRKLAPHAYFETYAGVGFGNAKNTHYTGMSTVKNNGFFLQPAFAVTSKDNSFQLAFFTKFNFKGYHIGDTTFAHDREPIVTHQMDILAKGNQFFWQPGISIRSGWKQCLFQLSYSSAINGSGRDLIYSNYDVSIGMLFRLNAGKRSH